MIKPVILRSLFLLGVTKLIRRANLGRSDTNILQCVLSDEDDENAHNSVVESGEIASIKGKSQQESLRKDDIYALNVLPCFQRVQSFNS